MRLRRSFTVLSAVALLVGVQVAAGGSATAADTAGQLDTTWGNQGVAVSTGDLADFARDSAATIVRNPSNGRFAAVGTATGPGGSWPAISVTMFDAAGELVPSFGGDGSVVIDPTLGAETAVEAEFDQVGRLFIVGTATKGEGGGEGTEFVVRVRTDGSLDTNFGSGGVARPAAGTETDVSRGTPTSLTVDFSGRLIVAGRWAQPPVFSGGTTYLTNDAYVRQYSNSGQPNLAFGAGGASIVHLREWSEFFDVRADASRIYAAGGTMDHTGDIDVYDSVVARFDLNGQLDTTWSGDGIAQMPGATSTYNGSYTYTTYGPTNLMALAVAPGGAVYASGTTLVDPTFHVIRLTSAGDLDQGWGTGGTAAMPAPAASRMVESLSLLGDGSVIGVGWTAANNWHLVTFRATAGGFDLTYGGDGLAETTIPGPAASGGNYERGSGGGLLVGSTLWTLSEGAGSNGSSDSDLYLRKWNATAGTVDSSYYGGARAIDADVQAPSFTYGGTAGADGRTAVVGQVATNGYDYDTSVAVFRADGTPDTSFGGDGTVTIDAGTTTGDYAEDASFAPDGGLYVAGNTGDAPAITKLAFDGSVISAFGEGGATDAGLPAGWAIEVESLADGVVALLDDGNGGQFVAHLDPFGHPVAGFGTDGLAPVALPSSWWDNSLAVDETSGRIAVAGGSGDAAQVAVIDLATGSPVADIGAGTGIATAAVPGADINTSSVAVRPDGTIVAAGSTKVGGIAHQFATRWTADGQLDAAFSDDGVHTWRASDLIYGEWVTGLDVDDANRPLIASAAWTSNSAITPFVTRLDADGELDPTFGDAGIARIDNFGQAQPYGITVSGSTATLPVSGTGRHAAVRLINDVIVPPADVQPPLVTRTVPADDVSYSTGEQVTSVFSCSDPNLASCVATVNGVDFIEPGGLVDTTTPGVKNFKIIGTDLAGNTNVVDTRYFVVTGTGGPVEVPAGDVVTVGAATPEDPYSVALQTSTDAGGPVSVTVVTDGSPTPDGYAVLGAAYVIEAPPGTVDAPLTITFRLDGSVLDNTGITWDMVEILRDGVALESCVTTPVPCVDAQYQEPDEPGGDIVISVRTDHASTWQTAVRDGFTVTGFFAPVDNPDVLNTVKAGSGVPVKFSLGGDQGLNVFDTGSPSSQTMACGSKATQDDIEQTVSAGSSGLSYDATSERYTYVWKTQKAWAGTCRQLTVRFTDGSERTAWFKLTK